MKVSVVIVNHNGGEWVLGCLAALQEQTRKDFALLIVDNASSDGSLDRIALNYPEARLIIAHANLGFAAAVNLALKEVNTEWLALLNPDATPAPAWLDELLRAAQTHSGCAAFGSQLLRADDPARLDGIGDVYHVSGLVWRAGYGRRKQPSDDRPSKIFSPCAAAALYRTEAVRAVGGMDEALFCYLEDVDLGFRLRLAGYACRYVPSAVVYHQGSAIAGYHSDFQTFHSHRNVIRVFVKNMPGLLFWVFLPLHLTMNIATLVLLVLQGRGKSAWRAKRAAVAELGDAWSARGPVQATKRIGSLSLLRQLRWMPLRR